VRWRRRSCPTSSRANLVELRFFAGLTLEQAAECLDVSLSTDDRGWRYPRASLYTDMAGTDSKKDKARVTCLEPRCRT
jgi:hypothetical protein